MMATTRGSAAAAAAEEEETIRTTGEEDDEEDDDDEVVLPDPWYKLAWEETEREIVRIMQRLLNIWITRDPSKTTRLVLFSVMGTGLFLASLLTLPRESSRV